MLILRLAWRNIWRHTRRTLITAFAMSIGVAFLMAMLALMEGMFDKMFDALVVTQTGHMQIHHPEYPKKRALYSTLDDYQDIEKQLGGDEGVQGFSSRVFGFGLFAVGDEATGGQLTGIIPADEAKMNHLDQRIHEGRWLPDEAKGELVVGYKLAEKLKAKLGDEVVVVTSAADGSMGNELYKLVGTVKTGSQGIDRSGAYLHREDAQAILALEGKVHEVAILGGDRAIVPEFIKRVRGSLEKEGRLVRDWGEINPAAHQMLSSQDLAVGLYVFLVFAVAGLGVLNTMLMSVFERTKELGVTIALGMKPRQVLGLILMESIFLTSIAILIGLIIGGGLDYYIIEHGIAFGTKELEFAGFIMDPVIRGKFVAGNVLTAVWAVFFIAIVSALYPAWRASRLQPVLAMGDR
jgi:ABC-type lipoprotein release transport system permease subunit